MAAIDPKTRADLVGLLADCHDDPDLFNAAILGRDPYWWRQVEMGAAVARYRCVAIESGNAVGKDYWVGGLVPWWLWTRPGSLVIVTGPSQTLIGSVTWKEVRKAIKGARFPMGARISEGVKASPQTVKLGDGWGALGYSTTSVERASGQHAGELLVIVEEASGAGPEVWEALRSLKHTKLVAIGNPLRPDGGFVELIEQAARDAAAGVPDAERCHHINIPSTDSPHATWDHSPFGLADRTWLDEQVRHYGGDSLWVRCHIKAIRPKLSHEQLIPDGDLDFATRDEHLALREVLPGGRRKLACDVGEGVGNANSVVVCRDDLGVLDLAATPFEGPKETARTIARMARRWEVREADVSYDAAGQTGKRLGNALAAEGLARAVAYFGSGGGGRRCTNLRTACAMALARRLDRNHRPDPARPALAQPPFHIPPGPWWPALREELRELRYKLKGSKSALEDKEDFMDRLGRSPDFADALGQSFREEAIRG